MERTPHLHDLFDEVALLVDLDRVHPAVDASVVVFLDSLGEGVVDALDAVTHDVREADEQRQLEARAFSSCVRS